MSSFDFGWCWCFVLGRFCMKLWFECWCCCVLFDGWVWYGDGVILRLVVFLVIFMFCMMNYWCFLRLCSLMLIIWYWLVSFLVIWLRLFRWLVWIFLRRLWKIWCFLDVYCCCGYRFWLNVLLVKVLWLLKVIYRRMLFMILKKEYWVFFGMWMICFWNLK